MRLIDVQRLLLLAAIWGSSFIFFRIIVPVLGPIVTVELRVVIAGIALLSFAVFTKTDLEWQQRWPWYAGIGVLGSAIPFVLIAFAEVHLTASIASILNATTPLFAAIIAAMFFDDAFTWAKTLGLTLGFAGVIVLVGWSPFELTSMIWLSVAAMLGASFFYGLSANLTRMFLKGAPPLGASVGGQLASSFVLLPFIPFNPPTSTPNLVVLLSVLALGLVCTAFAYVLYFRLILDISATRTSTVTFIVPIFGVIWGALFLHEPIGVEKVVACVIILLGASLVTGLYQFRKIP